MRWFKHLVKKPPGRLPLEVFHECPTGKSPWGKPRTCGRDYISCLTCGCLQISQEKLESEAGEKVAWNTLLRILPSQPDFG